MGIEKICSNGHGLLIKMASVPIYGKNTIKNLLLQNQKSFMAESWCIAAETQGLPNLFN